VREFFCVAFASIFFCLFAEASIAEAIGDSLHSQITERVSFGATSPIVRLPSGFVRGSDTLTISDRVLVRSRDYSVDSQFVAIIIESTKFVQDSTLFTCWVLRPEFLLTLRSNVLGATPSIVILPRGTTLLSQRDSTGNASNPTVPFKQSKSDFFIRGSKRVTVAGSSSGGNKLSQGLELTLGGHLSERVTVEGELSDDGSSIPVSRYDAPTSSDNVARLNSTLEQLDRLHLSIKGPEVTLRLGDLASEKRPESRARDSRAFTQTSLTQPSSLFGISAGWGDQRSHVTGTVARPRGRRTTLQFRGQDNLQGPYRITDKPGGSAIVPGSEQVWLDGELLTRGGAADYTVDYTVGTILFTSRRLIDSRSRIEIDLELTTDAYRQEFLATSFGTVVGDSNAVVQIELQREQDNSSRPLADSSLNSSSDFAPIGDEQLTRSGIFTDSLGDYELVVDSLPDSVLVYVGKGNGSLSLRATFVGAGRGSYRYLGDGRYQFVGTGNGDYLPVIRLVSPKRLDELHLSGVICPNQGIQSHIQYVQSSRDLNLLSNLDDADNLGRAYRLTLQTDSSLNRLLQFSGAFQYQESHYSSIQRFFEPDVARQYLMPGDSLVGGDRVRHSAVLGIRPHRNVYSEFSVGRYAHRSLFSADEFGFTSMLGSVNGVTSRFDLRFVDALSEITNQSGRLNEQKLSVESSAERKLRGQLTGRRESREHRYDTTLTKSLFSEFTGTASIRNWGSVLLAVDQLDSAHESVHSKRQSVRTIGGFNHSFGSLALDGDIGWQSITLNKTSDAAASIRVRFIGDELPKKLRWSLDYRLQRELATARGYAFLEVPSGEGEYRREDSVYVSDPNGNFIRIEEIVSDSAVVSRGEKNARVDYKTKQLHFYTSSEVLERRLDQSTRSLLWLLPWYSSERDTFQSVILNREIRTDWFERLQGYPLTLAWSEERESRSVVVSRDERRDWRYSATGRFWIRSFSGEIEGERYGNRRNSVYGLAGDIDGRRGRITVRQSGRVFTPSVSVELRRANESAGDTLTQCRITPGLKFLLSKSTGLRADGNFSLEWYRNSATSGAESSSLLLTGNRRGSNGAVLSLQGVVRAESGLSARLSLTSTFANEFRPIVSGRGELVASF
jgi:hypothetical protein